MLILRLGLSLGLVFGLMWVAIRVMRGRDGLARRNSTDVLEILERKALTKNTSIALVRVGDQALAVGITEQSITLLNASPIDPTSDGATEVVEIGGVSVTEIGAFESSTPVQLEIGSAPAMTVKPSGSFLDTLRDLTVRHEVRVDR